MVGEVCWVRASFLLEKGEGREWAGRDNGLVAFPIRCGQWPTSMNHPLRFKHKSCWDSVRDGPGGRLRGGHKAIVGRPCGDYGAICGDHEGDPGTPNENRFPGWSWWEGAVSMRRQGVTTIRALGDSGAIMNNRKVTIWPPSKFYFMWLSRLACWLVG